MNLRLYIESGYIIYYLCQSKYQLITFRKFGKTAGAPIVPNSGYSKYFSVFSTIGHNGISLVSLYDGLESSTEIIQQHLFTLLNSLNIHEQQCLFIMDNEALSIENILNQIVYGTSHRILFLPPGASNLSPANLLFNEWKHQVEKIGEYTSAQDIDNKLAKAFYCMSQENIYNTYYKLLEQCNIEMGIGYTVDFVK